MYISPVSEKDASENVKKEYETLKKAFRVTSVPVFITYLGAFPPYLSYITEQLTQNLTDPSFLKIVEELHENFKTQIEFTAPKSEDTRNWITRYKASPEFYTFQKDLYRICVAHMKLACIFIGLREAVKGWAVAAKKLKAETAILKEEEIPTVTKEEFVFDTNLYLSEMTDQSLTKASKQMTHGSNNTLVVDILSEYVRRCGMEYKLHLKREEFLSLRVQFEKNILHTLSVFPHLIYSPYNVIAKLIGKDENFSELLHLLSDNFPTLSMQRLMFSEFMFV